MKKKDRIILHVQNLSPHLQIRCGIASNHAKNHSFFKPQNSPPNKTRIFVGKKGKERRFEIKPRKPRRDGRRISGRRRPPPDPRAGRSCGRRPGLSCKSFSSPLSSSLTPTQCSTKSQRKRPAKLLAPEIESTG